jgi:RNA polymerase sigma-70 factor (ECF subfamily)
VNTRHSVDADPRIELVVSAMASLNSNDREALRLVLWEELTHAQAATVLNCTVNAFEIRYRRARNSVKNAVERVTSAPLTTTTPINKPDIAKGVPQ